MKKVRIGIAVAFAALGIASYVGWQHAGDANIAKSNEVFAAQVDYFLKIDSIEVESKGKGHEKEIDILSWSWGYDRSIPAGGTGGGGAGKVQMRDITVTMHANKATPKLLLACANGEHLREIKLTAQAPKRGDFLIYTFSNCSCTSYSDDASMGDIPTESLSLNYEKVKVEYTPQDAKGASDKTQTAEWDFASAE